MPQLPRTPLRRSSQNASTGHWLENILGDSSFSSLRGDPARDMRALGGKYRTSGIDPIHYLLVACCESTLRKGGGAHDGRKERFTRSRKISARAKAESTPFYPLGWDRSGDFVHARVPRQFGRSKQRPNDHDWETDYLVRRGVPDRTLESSTSNRDDGRALPGDRGSGVQLRRRRQRYTRRQHQSSSAGGC